MDGGESEKQAHGTRARKKRKRANIPPSEVKPLGKQTPFAAAAAAHMEGGEVV